MRNEGISLKQAAKWCGGTVAPQFEEVRFSGAQFDTRKIHAGMLFVAMIGARDGHDFADDALHKGAAAVLASRPLQEDIPAIYVENTLTALQAIARSYRSSLQIETVGITGSVGKTTTKEMITAVLRTTFATQKSEENYNNDIGVPVSVLSIAPEHEKAVLEMGMNHFGEISLLTSITQPDIAVITNVGRMHIENLGSEEGILQAKLEILEGLKPGGTAIFCGDIPRLYDAAKKHGALTFGRNEDNDIRAVDVRTEKDGICFTALGFGKKLPIFLPVQGEHNVTNALAAVAVGLRCGVSAENIAAGLADFKNTGMRQRIYDLGALHIIEDCYNAGPESMRAALAVLSGAEGRKIAVLGGMLELGDFAPKEHYEVGREAAKVADALFAYGTHSEEYVRGANDAGLSQAQCFDSHEALAEALKKTLLPGDTLLVKGSRGMKMERVLRLLDTDDGRIEHG